MVTEAVTIVGVPDLSVEETENQRNARNACKINTRTANSTCRGSESMHTHATNPYFGSSGIQKNKRNHPDSPVFAGSKILSRLEETAASRSQEGSQSSELQQLRNRNYQLEPSWSVGWFLWVRVGGPEMVFGRLCLYVFVLVGFPWRELNLQALTFIVCIMDFRIVDALL